MKLMRSAHHEIAEMRATKAGSYRVPLPAGFHAHLAGHAQAYRVVDGAATVGYALVLEDRHGDHVHYTPLENLHLKAVRNVFVHVRGGADAPSLEELQATVPRDE